MTSPETPKITNGTSNGGYANGTANGGSPRDGNDYLRVMNRERDRLLAQADKLDAEIEGLLKAEVPEETIGHLRAATGKARLLSSQKMVQFEGLCQKNVKPPPDDPCPTKLQDLQGFWDMLLIQVENIDQAFAQVEQMRANGWKIPSPEESLSSLSVTDGASKTRSTPLVRRPLASKPSPAPSPAALMAAQKREAQRKQLAELKRQYKMQQQKGDPVPAPDIQH